MTYVIAEPCIGQKEQSCVAVCPVDCIIDVGPMLLIDPTTCIDCGACESECPVDAIFREDALPEQWSNYTAINAAWEDQSTVDNLLTVQGSGA
jgi:ferredoxin